MTDQKKIFLVITIIIIVCLAAFGRMATNDFINFDDSDYVTENYQVQQGINLQTVKWAFTTTYCSNWHPLTWLSHMLDWSIFGAQASGHHLVSLLLHIGAAIFLFLFLNKTTNNIWASAFAAAFFALHPLRVESVAWIAERKDVLSMFFGMACLYAYASYVEASQISKYFLCLILFSLAMMSKPMMVTLPFILMLLDYWPLKRWQKAFDLTTNRFDSAEKLVLEKVPFICLAVAASIAAFWAQNKEGTVASLDFVPVTARTANAVVSYTSYLGKIFWPFNMAVFYPYENYLPIWKVLISGVLLILITLAVLYYIKKMPFLFVGWFTYLGTLVPVIGMVQVGSQAMADRYTYLPSVGIAVMLAWGIPFLIRNEKTRRNILFPASMLFLSMMAFLIWQQCGYWRDSIALFSHTLSVTNNNALAHNQLGLAFFEKNKNGDALYHYNKSILIQSLQDSVYNNRGAVYLKYGRYQQALNDFNKAIAINPSYINAYNNRANIHVQTGHYELAIEDLREAVRLNPYYIIAYYNRGLLLAKLGKYQSAINDLDEAIHRKEDYADAYNTRAAVYLNQSNMVWGCRDAKKACELGICATLQAAAAKGLCR